MASIKLNTTDKTYTEQGNDTLLGNVIDGLRAPLMPADEVPVNTAVKFACAAYATGGVAVGSTVARGRAAEGKAPIAKFFF